MAEIPQFDEERWGRLIQKPDWYFEYLEFQKSAKEMLDENSQEYEQLKNQIRDFFEQTLIDGKVALAADGPDLDRERLLVDTIVIHHTSDRPGYRLSRMNAVQLLNVYAPYFTNPTTEGEEQLKGQPIWSNHLEHGRPVFYLYHWLMRMDGSFERLLFDEQLGWHAANWEINRRSVAICLDNDYEKQDPSGDLLQKLAHFIVQHYPSVSIERIYGHKEVSKNPTLCPGGNFTDGWKNKLLELVTQVR